VCEGVVRSATARGSGKRRRKRASTISSGLDRQTSNSPPPPILRQDEGLQMVICLAQRAGYTLCLISDSNLNNCDEFTRFIQPFPRDTSSPPHQQNLASPILASPTRPLASTAAPPPEIQMYRYLLRQPALALGVVGASTLGSSGDQQHRPCSAASPSPPLRTPLLPFRGPPAAAEEKRDTKTEEEKRVEQDERRKLLWERTRVRIFTRVLPRSFPPLSHPLGSHWLVCCCWGNGGRHVCFDSTLIILAFSVSPL